jgi:alkyl hydroperoxide reductase subunit AhpF
MRMLSHLFGNLSVSLLKFRELLEDKKFHEHSFSEFQLRTPTNKEYDVIIAGGGPAGISSAIYSARIRSATDIIPDVHMKHKGKIIIKINSLI